MNIITLIDDFTSNFNEKFSSEINPLNIERKIRTIGDDFTISLYEKFLTELDLTFKNSSLRKESYYVKETIARTLITSVGCINIKMTAYRRKDNNERYVFLRELLNLKPYQRLTNEAEYSLTKYAMENNMSQSAKYALRNTILSRSTVSKLLQKLDGSIIEKIERKDETPNTLYIEMDEIHANLQNGNNQICPCAIVHEGHKENFTKRKELKNVRAFATVDSYSSLYEVIYDYINKAYDTDKIKTIFISGDGAKGIKAYDNCFNNAIFVLDKFHYKRKHLKHIFKNNDELINTADSYIRNDMIDEFKELVKIQIEKFPEQEKSMTKSMNYIISNLEGIKNQQHSEYKCSCSMEGHVSNQYARYITSIPYGFSIKGLRNKLKLLVYKANKINLTIEDYYDLKYGEDEYKKINENIQKMTNIKVDRSLRKEIIQEYKINTNIPVLDTNEANNKLKEMISIRKEIYII